MEHEMEFVILQTIDAHWLDTKNPAWSAVRSCRICSINSVKEFRYECYQYW